MTYYRSLPPVGRRYSIDEESGCWNWTQGTSSAGYGLVKFGGEQWIAPRLYYFVFVGPIPEGVMVCHHCDNPRCVNPDHLFLGTAKDTHDDAVEKGRKPGRRGMRAPNAKLTDDQVRAIRADNRHQAVIGKEYGLHQTAVCRVRNRVSYRNVE